MQWLRRSFIAGFFVVVPLFISAAALIWLFGVVDGFTSPLYDRLLGRRVPGLGILTTALVILLAGAIATNVIGRQFLQRGENILARVPVFGTIYAPVKLCPGQAARCRLLTGQRVRVQAGGVVGGQAGSGSGLPNEGIRGGSRAGAGADAGGLCAHKSLIIG
jgi:hypothetical protein